MTSTLALWAALAVAAPQQADVRSFHIQPAGEATEIVIDVAGGAVSVRDYMLQAPARLVIDVVGARHALSSENYPGIGRGGVVGVRTSQYEAATVRLVFDLTEAVAYEVQQNSNGVRVVFQNPVGPFAAWSSSTAPLAVVQAPERLTPLTPTTTPMGSAQRVSAPPVIQEEPRITVTFEATPILDVLNTFSEFTGRSIIAGPNLGDISVNAELRNQPWDVALETILDANGLTIRETETGILRVDKTADLAGRLAEEELVTETFRLNYVSVDSLLPAVRDLLSERGQATKSSASNLIIITDASSVVSRLREVIARLDAPTPQVTIAAKIIFIDRTALEDLGFVYDLKDARSVDGNQLNDIVPGFADADGDGVLERTFDDNFSLGGSSVAAIGNATQRVGSPALRLVGSIVEGGWVLTSFIEALSEQRLSDIQAEPVITTMDNREAEVLVGQATPIRVIDAAAGGGEGGFPVASVETRETGIILRVRPHVTGDQVYLQIHAERSEALPGASDVGVVFATQRSSTEVLLNDGETAVISGLTVIDRAQIREGIPFLMDLPFIGFLFRRTFTQDRKQDLLIMVTPHIVKAGEV